MNKEEITKEDILNATGSMIDTMLDYIEKLKQTNEQHRVLNGQLREELDIANTMIKELENK